jgi:hypothetical protein
MSEQSHTAAMSLRDYEDLVALYLGGDCLDEYEKRLCAYYRSNGLSAMTATANIVGHRNWEAQQP